MFRIRFASALLIAVALSLAGMQATQPQSAPSQSVLEIMKQQASALREVARSDFAKVFLHAAGDLPAISERKIYRDDATRTCFTAAQAQELPEEKRQKLREIIVTDKVYYFTMYDTPMAYFRPIEILGNAGATDFSGKRILDIGYGTVGHLRMMASRGAHVVGLDVDSLLTALYSEPGDQGPFGSGSVTLVNGRLNEDHVKQTVGGEFDFIISKNTLKRGYIHPPADIKVDPRMLIDLGLSDEAFLQTLHSVLKPGGKMLIYNLSPKQADVAAGENFIPWADGRCPFERELLEKTGFRIIEFDRDDTEAARTMGHALGWAQRQPPMNFEKDLFAHYTLLAKR